MARKIKTETSGNWHRVTSYAGDVTKVDLYHLETGIHARGNAKRYHTDVYDNSIGENIAYFRALSRIGQKIVTKKIKDLAR